MNATEPTYFLYSGWLFHAAALPALRARLPERSDDAGDDGLPRCSEASSSTPQPRRSEDPGPEGPEGEPVGEEDEPAPPEEAPAESSPRPSKPVPGPGAPMFPERGAPDANPIDPRVF